MHHAGTRILDVLQSCRKGDNFLHRAAQTTFVILPIENIAQVWHFASFSRRSIFQPLAQIFPRDRRCARKDGNRNGSLRSRRAVRFRRDDVFAHQTFILDEIRGFEKLCESSRRRHRRGLPIAVFCQRFTHNARFRNVIDELFVVNFFSFRVEHVQKSIGDVAYSLVHLFQRLPS